jgi:hypothetical protein
MATIAIEAMVSQAITHAPWVNALPFNPIICSVEIFVRISEAAITYQARLRPARKYPEELPRFVPRVFHQAITETIAMKRKNVSMAVKSTIYSFS